MQLSIAVPRLIQHSRSSAKDALFTHPTSHAGTAGGTPLPVPFPCNLKCPASSTTTRSSVPVSCLKLGFEWRLLRDTEHFLQPFKEQTKRCEVDNVTLDQLQESMDFLVDHFEKQLHKHRSDRPFVECITTGWYTMDKYYNKIDEIGAYAAATLLHPNKRRAYLQAAWKPRWIKPGLRRAEELWAKKYEKAAGRVHRTLALCDLSCPV